ncbi:DUF1059 domain-containing protein [Vogesella sp. LYT5W]|uniref:DUF1059 domain-containing protein n=1 Tax=Vogesella margarita TaxID=2984199 RepID=A0ABT5IKL3_9NEIS|nr:DUF1059 domain-containing protein [Vogesella margarita]MDC7713096.1 DUF1059 domain-containing protein [Vogesella margarita]
MARKLIDCREHGGSPPQCTVSIAADNEDELLAAAVQHAVAVHGYQDTPELRAQLRKMFKEEQPMH